MLGAVCISAVFYISLVSAAYYEPCMRGGAKIIRLDVDPCGDPQRCNLVKGRNATISMSFIANEDTKILSNVVHGVIDHIPIPFPVGKNACGKNVKCPLKKGDTVNYSAEIAISEKYPSLSLVVKWELQDSSKDVICIGIPVRIVNAAERTIDIQ